MRPNVTVIEKNKGDLPMQSRATRRVLGISVSADASPEDVQTIRMATINVSVLILFSLFGLFLVSLMAATLTWAA